MHAKAMSTKVCKLEAAFSSISCSDQTPPHYPFSLFLLPLDVLKPYRSRLKYPRNQLLPTPPKKKKVLCKLRNQTLTSVLMKKPCFTWSLVWKCEAEKNSMQQQLVGLKYSTSTFSNNTNIVISERPCDLRRLREWVCVYPRNELLLLLEMCNCDPNNLNEKRPSIENQ